MALAKVTGNNPAELANWQDVAFIDQNGDDVRASYQSVSMWGETERNAVSLYTIQEQSVPDGKMVVGSALSFDGSTVTRVFTLTDIPLTSMQADKIEAVLALRAQKLAAGFDYNFNDARGVHRIGTTEADEAGWDKVSKLAGALVALGVSTTSIGIVTDTGPATVTALEWQQVLVAAGQFGQPLYARSFTLEAQIAAAASAADLAGIDITTGWS